MIPPSLENMFLSVCHDWFESNGGFDVRGELGVFSSAAVVWLGISQRISGGTLQAGVSELIARLEEGTIASLVSRQSKKLREGNVSLNTGGLSRAQERLSLESVTELFSAATTRIFKDLTLTPKTSAVYVMDGQTITVARTKANLNNFGKTQNGEGELHFPRIRAVSIHELRSGIAKQVAIGTFRDHEITLAREVITSLPKGAIVIMDRGFAKPSFLKFAQDQGIKVIVRLKDSVGIKLLGKPDLPQVEQQVKWNAATVAGQVELDGRVIKLTSEAKGFRSSEFYFLTTADELSLEDVAEYYRKRVRVETFIRELKQTLKLFFVRAKKPENIKKEITIAYLTFNLIRATMHGTAQALSIEPERISFTATVRLLSAYAHKFAAANNKTELDSLTLKFRTNLSQALIPKRKGDRSYPREVKYPRSKYDSKAVVRLTVEKEGK